MIVIDASAMIDALARHPNAGRIDPWLDDDLVAPDVLIAEVVRFFGRATREPQRSLADSAITDLRTADIDYAPVWPHLDRVWELRHTVSVYDACYVAVAEAHDCPVVTTDARLGRVRDLADRIIVV